MPDRFGNLEIPADRQLDLAFLDGALSLPRPLPAEAHAVAAYVGGRVYVPGDRPVEGDRVIVYDLVRALVPATPASLEAAWRATWAGQLAAVGAQVRGQVPVRVLNDAGALNAAREAVRARLPGEIPDRHRALPGQAHTDDSAWLRVVGQARLLRLADKLYDLQTLHEYTQRFAKAVDAEVMARLAALPLDASPELHLEVIAQNLDKIHPKARSPLRNKLDTTRVVLGGVTLLPLYLGPVAALFDRYAARLSDQLRLDVLGAGA